VLERADRNKKVRVNKQSTRKTLYGPYPSWLVHWAISSDEQPCAVCAGRDHVQLEKKSRTVRVNL
jgi:hypothetical protein